MPTTEPAALHGDEAAFYAREAERLQAAVARLANVSEQQLEDACAFAWLVFVRVQPRRSTAFAFLVVVAKHEAWRLARLDARHQLGPANDWTSAIPDETSDLCEQVHARERLRDVVAALPERQRRLLGLKAFGFDYDEIAALTGDSARTVERQLQRAYRRLDPLRTPLGA